MMRKETVRILALLILAIFCTQGTGLAENISIPTVEQAGTFNVPDNEALRMIRDMKAGWNLGNTFDAYDDTGWFKAKNPADMETAWVNVKTTPELIQAVYDAGFRTLRMPVSWHNHVDENDVIHPEWMARVREVADIALNLGMYVIVNVHHDNQEKYFYPDSAHYERSAAYLQSVWTQMAEAFADCGDHLILESMNEPRLVGTDHEWWWDGNDAACRDAADCINRLNQLFVDTVRATGGNNASRYLLVPGYDGSPWYASDEAFQLPEDTVDNRIIIEAHAYTPYSFCLDPNSTVRTFDLENAAQKAEILDFMNALYKRFVSKGVPVLLDEFGAMDRNGNLQDRVNFTAFYVSAARVRGITCCWWDNHVFAGNEPFGLMERKTAQVKTPEIVEAFMAYCD